MDGVHLLTAAPTSGPDGVLNGEILSRDAWFSREWDMKDLRVACAPIGRRRAWERSR